ncbi:MAG: hypothetical protein ACTHKQ_01085 [Mesorhizobium sp.]
MQVIETTNVPCARYEGGEGEERVCAVFAYALGLIGTDGILKEIGGYVARVYDYKGDLIIATRKQLPASWRMAFKRAWAEMGNEPAENVQFLPVTSDDWDQYWGSRRFDSDWEP